MTSQTIAPQQPHVADSHAAIMGQLIDFINHNLLVEDDIDAVDADTPMLELGVLDSLAMVSLLTFVESDLGVRLPDDAVVPEHFETPRALAGLIAAHQEAQPAPGAKREGHHILADTVAILEAAGIERNTVALASGERMHILQVDGATPTWVMLPGLGNPSSSWGMMLRSLADEQAAVAVDLAGFGLSTCPQERPTYADHLRALMTLLETAVTPPYVLVGSSAGALLAAEIARQYPEQDRRFGDDRLWPHRRRADLVAGSDGAFSHAGSVFGSGVLSAAETDRHLSASRRRGAVAPCLRQLSRWRRLRGYEYGI